MITTSKYRCLWILFLLLFQNEVLGQKESYNWYFGTGAGITFNTSPPIALTNGQIKTFEGTSTISAPSGRLLFYTDGLTIFDSTHNIMLNGSGLKGNTSTTQSALIVPFPDSVELFFVFCMDDLNGPDGLTYNVVDMRLNNGRGAVVSSIKNIKLRSGLAEQICAVHHSNRRDFWLLAHTYPTDTILAYKITPLGIDTVPIVSKTGLDLQTGVFSSIGYMKVSPDGTKLASAHYGKDTVTVADFNPSYGNVNNVWKLPMRSTYSMEFSPNSRYMYINEWVKGQLYQFDVKSSSFTNFLSSSIRIDSTGSSILSYATMQLGPDKKIYINRSGESILAVIHAPDSQGLSSRIQRSYVSLNGRLNTLGLPNFISSMLFPRHFVETQTCQNDTTFFTLNRLEFMDSIHWDFGETSSSSRFSNKRFDVCHQYRNPGYYTVKAYFYFEGIKDSFVKKIRIHDSKPQLGKDTFFCQSFLHQVIPHKNFINYNWNSGPKTKSISVNYPGTFILNTKDSSGCLSADTITITAPVVKSGFTMSDTMMCNNKGAITFTDTSVFESDQKGSLKWVIPGFTTTDSVFTKRINDTGIISVRLVSKSQLGCLDSITKTIRVKQGTKLKIVSNKDTQCYKQNAFDFAARAGSVHASTTYSWQIDGLTDPSMDSLVLDRQFNTTGLHQLLLATDNVFGCKDTFIHNVMVLQSPVAKMTLPSSRQCFKSNVFEFTDSSKINGDSIKIRDWYLEDGFTSVQKQFQHSFASDDSFDVRLIVSGSNGCKDTINSIVVAWPMPVVDFKVPNDTQCWQRNHFNIINNTSIKYGKLNHAWDFGDGTKDTVFEPKNKKYPNLSASYWMNYKAISEHGCADSGRHRISLLERPLAYFSAIDSVQCLSQNEFELINSTRFSAMNTLSYTWYYSQNDSSKGINAKKMTYSSDGFKKIKLFTTSNLNNCRDTFENSVLVAWMPKAGISWFKDSQCYKGNAYTFKDSSSITSGTWQSEWRISDNTINSQKSFTHQFNQSGNFKLTMKVISSEGCIDSGEMDLFVSPQTNIQFKPIDTSLCQKYNQMQTINSSSIQSGTFGSSWFVDNVFVSGAKDLSNLWIKDSGWHKIKLITMTNKSCSDTFEKSIYVEGKYGYKILLNGKDSACLNGNEFNWQISKINSMSILKRSEWDLGDGSTSTQSMIKHSYSVAGLKNIRLITESENNCIDTNYSQVFVLNTPKAIFESDTVCFPQMTTFTNKSQYNYPAGNLNFWSFGDGAKQTTLSPQHAYLKAGSYQAKLKVVNGFGCMDSVEQTVRVRIKPKADFTYLRLDDKDAYTSQLQFKDASSSDVNWWYWDFSNGVNSTEQSPLMLFTDTNSRPVVLMVKNADACADTARTKTETLYTTFSIHIPTAFSPNGDEINEVFIPLASPFVRRYTMEIYNRWGECVFRTDDILKGWDGTYGAEKCEQGIYLCKIFVVPLRGKIQSHSFSITLLR